jgi:nitrate reductase alpha subunit
MDNGLHIENLDLTIPWKTSLDEIEDYGQPEIIVLSDQRTDALWKNAKIFGGLTLDLTAMFWRTLFGRNKFDNAHAYIDKETFDKFKPHLDEFFNQIVEPKKKNELEYYYRWTTNKCKITLGQGDRFGTYYYLDIKKKNWL